MHSIQYPYDTNKNFQPPVVFAKGLGTVSMQKRAALPCRTHVIIVIRLNRACTPKAVSRLLSAIEKTGILRYNYHMVALMKVYVNKNNMTTDGNNLP